MSRNSWKYLVDSLLFICIVGIVLTGILMRVVIPRGPTLAESSKYFLGLHRNDWRDIHFFFSIAFVFLIAGHLALNWSWIKCQAGQIFKKGWTAALILTALVSILVHIILWSFFPRPAAFYVGYGYRSGRIVSSHPVSENEGDIIINGQVTFHQLEKITGLDSARIIKALGLPPETPRDETLGQLRKIYPFTLQQVREVLNELEKNAAKAEATFPEETTKAKIESQETKPISIKSELQLIEAEEEPKLVVGLGAAKNQSSLLINGQMTLYDLERSSGLSAREIADKLGLPAGVPLDEHLGRLSKRYRFSLQDIRQAVSSLLKQKDQKSEEQKNRSRLSLLKRI